MKLIRSLFVTSILLSTVACSTTNTKQKKDAQSKKQTKDTQYKKINHDQRERFIFGRLER
ncbi:MAG: hypothetical protein CL676_11195 [Bdellovibrionaceae bacterium]|nr:hypothetical protein [Pseudobdellovibrionaceae bacterium]|tara:strand:- start:312 stop:491 length:180 start_codon:yes stop_codon:yes gene_type:complete